MALIQCKECCRDITEEEYKRNGGYCNSCYKDKSNIESKRNQYNHSNNSNNVNYSNNENDSRTNTVAKTIKILSVLGAIIGIIYAIILGQSVYTEGLVFPVIIISVISAIFVFGFGEIIQLLEDIKNK